MQTLVVRQEFNAPQQEIFDYLSNHNNLSSVLNANIKRIKDADGNNPNGVGSVRSIKLGIEILQETVVVFDAPNLIEYKISSNAPINYHLGTLAFSSPSKNKTLLVYTIQLESKFAIIDPILVLGLRLTIQNGLKKLATKYK